MQNNPETAWSFLLRELLTFQRNFTLEHDTRFSTHWSLSVISAPKILHVEQWSFSVRIGPLKDIKPRNCDKKKIIKHRMKLYDQSLFIFFFSAIQGEHSEKGIRVCIVH